jgi:hypothetical protein
MQFCDTADCPSPLRCDATAPKPKAKAGKSPLPHMTPPEQKVSETDESPDLLGFRAWRGVYFFVLGCFVLCVVLLAVLSRLYP